MSSSDSSPEFDFWMLGNPSFPQPPLLTADELFVDGVLLPLHLLHFPHPDPQPKTNGEPASSLPAPGLSSTPPPPPPPPPPPLLPSKRWKDIFKALEKKDKRRGSATELNIHIWPFSRSSSTGNGGRTRAPAAGRKVNSEPCSLSNSCSESIKPTSTTTKRAVSWVGLSTGIHLSRSRPVWQLRRSSQRSEPKEKNIGSCGGKNGGGSGGVRVLKLNVNTCIGYRNQLGFRGDDQTDGVAGNDGGGGGGDGSGGGGDNGSLFSLRTIFSKRVN